MPFRKTISLIILCALFSSKALFGATSPEASFVWASAGVATSTALFQSPKDRLPQACKAAALSLAGAFTTLGLKNLAENHENFYAKNSLNTAAVCVYLCAQNRWNPFIKASWKGLLSKHSGKEISFFMLNSLAPAAIAWAIETQKSPASTEKILAKKDLISPPEATDSGTPPPTPRATNPKIYVNFAQTPVRSPQALQRAETLEIYETPGREEDSKSTSSGDLDASRDEADFVADDHRHTPQTSPLSPVASTPVRVLASPQSPPQIVRQLFSQDPPHESNLQGRINFVVTAARLSVAHSPAPQRSASAPHQRPEKTKSPQDPPRPLSVPTPERAHAPEPVALTEQPKGPLKATVGSRQKLPKPPAAKAANPVKPRKTPGFGSSTLRFNVKASTF